MNLSGISRSPAPEQTKHKDMRSHKFQKEEFQPIILQRDSKLCGSMKEAPGFRNTGISQESGIGYMLKTAKPQVNMYFAHQLKFD